jgi:hypothetical protein
VYEGQRDAIIDAETWDWVQTQLAPNRPEALFSGTGQPRAAPHREHSRPDSAPRSLCAMQKQETESHAVRLAAAVAPWRRDEAA